jgi:hypothetical protein
MRFRLPIAAVAALAAPAAWAGMNGAVFFASVPTLDEVGLGALIALVAGVAGWAVRGRTRK